MPYLSYWPLVLGLIIGYFLPLLDHLIYIFIIEPQELTSQRVVYLLRNGNLKGSVKLLADTRLERSNLVFHSDFALIVILILTFWVITSSGSLLGSGLVIALSLHLLLDRFRKALYHRAS